MDIVARQKNIIVVVELKTRLCFDLLEQATNWLYRAHYVYCAVPKPKNFRINPYAKKCLEREGIGLLTVDFESGYWDYDFDYYDLDYYNVNYIKEFNKPLVKEVIKPKLFRKIALDWSRFLTEEHKSTIPGGSNGGGYITPYKRTMEEVKRILSRHPEGVSLEDLVRMCKANHYMNKKWGLYQALTRYETKWCEAFKQNGRTFFRLKKTQGGSF